MFALLFTIVSTQSCTDKCDGVNCQNGGACVDGTCNCPDGYSGASCEVEDRAKFIGTYNLSEICNSGSDAYGISIAKNPSFGVTEIIFNNLYNAGLTTRATVSGDDVTIFSQTLGTGTIEGSGAISGNTLNLTYSVTVGGNSDACTAVCTKQ